MHDPVLDAMLNNVRRNLLGSMHLARVRRGRAFRLHLLDPTKSEPLSTPDAFAPHFERVLRPLLSTAARCWFPLKEIKEVVRRYQTFQRTGAANPGEPVGHWARWSSLALGLTGWLDRCANVSGHQGLSAEVAADTLFWWWLVCSGFGSPPVLVFSQGALLWRDLAQRGFDPYYLLGGEKDKRWLVSKEYARSVTSRCTDIALLPTQDLDIEVVASGAGADRLYREAVERATLTHRLWPPDAKPPNPRQQRTGAPGS